MGSETHNPLYVAWGVDFHLPEGNGYWMSLWNEKEDGPAGQDRLFPSREQAKSAAIELARQRGLEAWEVDESGPLPNGQSYPK